MLVLPDASSGSGWTGRVDSRARPCVQVELTIGRKTMRSKAVKGDVSSGEFNFYQALEMEDDYAYDDEVSVLVLLSLSLSLYIYIYTYIYIYVYIYIYLFI